MRKILYISGTRADYGLMRYTLFRIREHLALKIEIVVTGMHLMPQFGRTVQEIKKDRFKIHRVQAVYKNDTRQAMADFIAEFISGLTKKIKRIKPDIILILGDRAEMFGAAVIGTYLNIPIVHIHGGDVSSTVDDVVRHSITKLSHIHLTATVTSGKRIIKMGEEPWRVHLVGAPGIDGILNEKLFSKREIARRYKLDASLPIVLIIQHPVTAEIHEAYEQMKETMEAVRELQFQAIVIYPNADAGGRKMIEVIKSYAKYPFIRIFRHIPYSDYLSLMKIASVMAGNSSSGIIEAASFGLPVVNIGSRQEGRERAGNVIDTAYKKELIKKALKKAAYDKKFRDSLKRCKNPYGVGIAGKKIAGILANLKIEHRLLSKRLTY